MTQYYPEKMEGKVVLVTGAAHRVGAAIVRTFHSVGANIVIHYRNSRAGAERLQSELNRVRDGSVALVEGELRDTIVLPEIIANAAKHWDRLDVLVNNASSFYPTPIGEATEVQWEDLFASNLKAPFFLSQSAAPYLKETRGNIINLVDIHAERPLKNYPVYSAAKAGLVMLTKSLARELGPDIRVNAIAPGAILWPEGMEEHIRKEIIDRTALKRIGDPNDIARAALYLVRDAIYTTGQILAVDGGRNLTS